MNSPEHMHPAAETCHALTLAKQLKEIFDQLKLTEKPSKALRVFIKQEGKSRQSDLPIETWLHYSELELQEKTIDLFHRLSLDLDAYEQVKFSYDIV